jgi:hypothetical protein
LRIVLSLSILLALASACASSPGRLEPNRFQHARYPYSLFYAEGGSADHPLGAPYSVVNFVAQDGRHYYAKLGPDFTIERHYRDEQPAQVGREPFYDLLLKREQPEARFWLRSVPLAKADTDQPLGALAQRYLSAAAKAVQPAPPFGVEPEPEGGASTELTDVRVRACDLSKREAVRLDFALKNPAAVTTLSEPEKIYASVVLVRSGYLARDRYPVLVVAGKNSNVAADPTLEQDFDRMLDRLVLGDKFKGLSMKGGHSCGKQAPAGTAEAGAGTAPASSGGDLRGPALEVPIVQEEAP